MTFTLWQVSQMFLLFLATSAVCQYFSMKLSYQFGVRSALKDIKESLEEEFKVESKDARFFKCDVQSQYDN